MRNAKPKDLFVNCAKKETSCSLLTATLQSARSALLSSTGIVTMTTLQLAHDAHEWLSANRTSRWTCKLHSDGKNDCTLFRENQVLMQTWIILHCLFVLSSGRQQIIRCLLNIRLKCDKTGLKTLGIFFIFAWSCNHYLPQTYFTQTSLQTSNKRRLCNLFLCCNVIM